MTTPYLIPPVLLNRQGLERKAGFEFEFGNLPIKQTAEALQAALGGELEAITPFEAVLHGTTLGRLKIERDADILKSVKYRKWLEQLGVEFSPGSLGHEIEANIDNASRILIPCEVVTDPIPFIRLFIVESVFRVDSRYFNFKLISKDLDLVFAEEIIFRHHHTQVEKHFDDIRYRTVQFFRELVNTNIFGDLYMRDNLIYLFLFGVFDTFSA